MRICQIVENVHEASAGPTYSVGRLSEALLERRHRCDVLTLGPAPASWPYRSALTVHSHRLQRAVRMSLPFTLEVRRRARTDDILHGHGVWRWANLFPAFAGRSPAGRLVCSPRGMLSSWAMARKRALKTPFWSLAQKPALRQVDCFHATALNELEDLRRLGFRQPIAVIPNGVDMPRRVEGRRENVVLFLSRIDPKKGLELLLPAWQRVEAEFPAWRLHVAGPLRGAYADKVRRLAADLGLSRCDFVGELQGPAKTAALSSARLFVLPSHSENFGIAVAEALAHATPVITTTATPWHEVARHGCGWCIELGEETLVATLRAALGSDAGMLAEQGARGRAWMRREFDWASIARRFELTYEWLLGRGPRPSWVIGGPGDPRS